MLKEKLKEDLKAALKAGESQKRLVVGMILSVIKNRELEKRGKLAKSGVADADLEAQSALTDEEALEAVSSEIKKRKEAIQTFVVGGRPELAENEKQELAILMAYMPEQMSEDEVKKLIAQAIADTGAAGPKEMGKVMGQLSPKIKGRFDGGRASALVKEALGA